MDRFLQRLLDISAITRDQTTLKAALAELADQFDFCGYGFLNLRPGETYAVSNFSPEWQHRYLSAKLNRHDPRIDKARRIRRAFSWSAEAEWTSLSKEGQRFFSAAGQFGIRCGISIPVAIANGAMSMLTFASSRPTLAREWTIDPIAAASAAGQMHARIESIRTAPSAELPIYLSPKEATYVRWLELGKAVDVVAEIEQVKYNTVRIALAEVRRRYDLCNNTQLVALAIRRGLI